MKRHLGTRLTVMMTLVVTAVVLFVAAFLLLNIALDYHRTFYTEMEQVIEAVEFFDSGEEEIDYLMDLLKQEYLLDPTRTDREYYFLKGREVLQANTLEKLQFTENLLSALQGEPNRQAGIFAKKLDFAYAMKTEGYTLYVVDHRTPLMESVQFYGGLLAQVLLAGLLLAAVLSYFFSRRFLIPVYKLTQGAKEMSQEGEFAPIEVISADEVGELTRVFNEMGVRISENVRLWRALLQNIPKPLFAVDEQGEVFYRNEAYRLLFEQEPDLSLFLEGHGEEKRFMLQLEGRYFCIYRSSLPLQNGTGTLFLLDDITDAEELERERKQFVADVSHELKTPLTVIKSYAETLQMRETEKEQQQWFLSVIDRSADQMSATVNQLLALIQAENAPVGPKEPLDLAATVRETVDAMALELKKKDLNCVLQLPRERALICEPDKVRRVLINLLSNAVKYSNEGGKITVSLEETEGGVLLAVADEGIGIEKKHLPFIFDKFYRVDKARSRMTGGTGLGLSIVRAMMESMGGTIKVESTFGEGSVFTCYFPD